MAGRIKSSEVLINSLRITQLERGRGQDWTQGFVSDERCWFLLDWAGRACKRVKTWQAVLRVYGKPPYFSFHSKATLPSGQYSCLLHHHCLPTFFLPWKWPCVIHSPTFTNNTPLGLLIIFAHLLKTYGVLWAWHGARLRYWINAVECIGFHRIVWGHQRVYSYLTPKNAEKSTVGLNMILV